MNWWRYPPTKKEYAASAMIAVAIIAFVALIKPRSSDLEAVARSVMLTAMERGYQCREAGRTLESCQAMQRERWALIVAGGEPGEWRP